MYEQDSLNVIYFKDRTIIYPDVPKRVMSRTKDNGFIYRFSTFGYSKYTSRLDHVSFDEQLYGLLPNNCTDYYRVISVNDLSFGGVRCRGRRCCRGRLFSFEEMNL